MKDGIIPDENIMCYEPKYKPKDKSKHCENLCCRQKGLYTTTQVHVHTVMVPVPVPTSLPTRPPINPNPNPNPNININPNPNININSNPNPNQSVGISNNVVVIPLQNGGFAIQNGGFPVQNGGFLVQNGGFPVNNGGYVNQNAAAGFQTYGVVEQRPTNNGGDANFVNRNILLSMFMLILLNTF
eukprot:Pgem_evm1s9805